MARILLIEDEKSISQLILFNLELEGHQCTLIENGRLARDYANELAKFHLIILDVMLPEVSGFDICRAFRAISSVPILFLSAKGNTTDRIAGLKLGANDYLPKPFDLEEFLLRCKILIDGIKNQTEISEIFIGNKRVDFTSYMVYCNENETLNELTKREIELLQLFVKSEGKVLSRDEILNELWTNDQTPTGRTIDNYILNFRKVFEKDPKNPVYFHSIRGIGYKFTNSLKLL